VQLQGRSEDVINEYLDRVRDEQPAPRINDLEGRGSDTPLEIREIRVVDSTGRPRFDLETGDTIDVEIAYTCRAQLPKAAFGVAVHRSDGTYVYGTNTDADGVPIALEPGEGMIALRFPDLQLMPANYRLVVAAFQGPAAPGDFREIQPAFRVRSRGRDEGTVRLAHEWRLRGTQNTFWRGEAAEGAR
jgi:hypothetical protein